MNEQWQGMSKNFKPPRWRKDHKYFQNIKYSEYYAVVILVFRLSHSSGTADFCILRAAAAAAKSLQLCPTLCDPIDGSPLAPPSLGFSRQEHWSGLPFPSPMHESEKWKWSRSVVSDPQRPHGLQPSRLLHPWDFLGRSTGVSALASFLPKNTQDWSPLE